MNYKIKLNNIKTFIFDVDALFLSNFVVTLENQTRKSIHF